MPPPEKRKMDNVTPSDDVLATAKDPLNGEQTSPCSPSKRPKQFSNAAAVIVSGGVPMQLSTRQASSAGTSTSFYPSLLGLLLLLSSSRILLLRAY